MDKPLISVVMPVYNADLYVSDAISSILSQTYSNFELIIIDDCSTDKSFEIISKFKDPRIRLFHNEKKCGVSESLNFGIEKSKGDYIVRMDSDDISVRDRFEIQIKHFKNSNCVVLGSSVIPFKDSTFFSPVKTTKNILIGIVDSYFYHPTVMFDKKFIELNKLKYSGHAEDFRLWNEILKKNKYKYSTFKNIDKPLLYYRLSDNQTTIWNKKNIKFDAILIRRRALKDYFKFFGYKFQFEKKDQITIYDVKNISKIFKDLKKEKIIGLQELKKKVIFYLLISIDRSKYNYFPYSDILKLKFLDFLKFINYYFLNGSYVKRY